MLGADVDIEIEVYDECNTVIDIPGIRSGSVRPEAGFVALVGVQSNQFPRALDSGVPFGQRHDGRSRRLPCLRLHRDAAGVAARPQGSAAISASSFTPARAKGRLDRAAARFRRRRGQADLQLPERHAGHGGGRDSRPAAARRHEGGRTLHELRRRARLSRSNAASAPSSTCRGASAATAPPTTSRRSCAPTPLKDVTRFFVTDDNFARNRNWEPILDRLIELREKQGFKIRLLLQVDTLCHRIPGFIEKAARAGCNAVFIGLENINPESLMGAKKRQNKIWEYRDMLQAWRERQGHDLGRLYPRLPDRYASNPSRATSRPSSANCRSTFSNSSS